MLLTIAVILGFGAIRISTGAITIGIVIKVSKVICQSITNSIIKEPIIVNSHNLSSIYQLWLQIIKRLSGQVVVYMK